MSYIGNSPGVASQRVTTTITATAGQTQFTTLSGYVLGYVDVYLNGAKLINGVDFEAITGTYVTLFTAAVVADVVELVSYVPRGLTDGYTKAEADAKFLDVTGDTATGTLSIKNTAISAQNDSVANWAYTSTLSSITNPNDIYFKPDGLKMFVAFASTITQYALTTAWDTATATAGTTFSMSAIDTGTLGLFFSPDGTKMVTCGTTGVVITNGSGVAGEDRAYYFTLSTAWDVTTATLVSSVRFAIGDAGGIPAALTSPQAVDFNSDGTIMYILDSTTDYVNQFALSTAYNVSTATYTKRLLISTEEPGGTALRFNSTGTRMYLLGSTSDEVNEYRLTTAWDIATAVYYDRLYLGWYELSTTGLYISESANAAFICGTNSDVVLKFLTDKYELQLSAETASGKIDLAGNTRVLNNFAVDGNSYFDGTIVTGSTLSIGSTLTGANITANQITTTTTAITLGGSVSTGATALTTTQTTGTITVGGTAATGAITLGQSTAAQTLNLGTGATATATTKTINIGTAGLSGSTTAIQIGSAVSGATSTITVNGTIGWTGPNIILSGTSTAASAIIRVQGSTGDQWQFGAGIVNAGDWGVTNVTRAFNPIVIEGGTNTPYFVWNHSSSEKMRLDASGNLGIGTATPTTFIHVVGGAASAVNVINWNARLSTAATGSAAYGAVGTGIYLDSFTNNGAGTQPIAGVSSYLQGGGTGGAATNHSGGIAFWTKNSASASLTRQVSIDSEGNLGVGVYLPGLPVDVAKTGVQVGSTTAYTIGRFREGVPNKGVTLGYDSGSQTGIVLSETTGASSNLAFWTYEAGISGWAERARINSNGTLLVGTTTETNNIRLGQKLALVNTSSYGGASIVGYEGTASGSRPLFDINRSRGTTDGSMTAVTAEDFLGSMLFRGADGTNFQDSSMVSGEVDGVVSTGRMPGRLSFHTADATGGVVERMRINAQGTVGVNVVPNSWYKGSSASTVQVYRASMYSDSSNSGFFGNNYLLNASGTEQFMANGYANRMLVDTGNFKFQTSSTVNATGGVANISLMKTVANIDVNGNMTLTGNIFPAAQATYSISTSGWTANTFYEVVAPGNLANQTSYWVVYRWDHISGYPYIMAGAFMMTVVNTNGTGTDNTFTPLGSSHTGGATMSFRTKAALGAATGLEASATAITNGTLTLRFYRFA